MPRFSAELTLHKGDIFETCPRALSLDNSIPAYLVLEMSNRAMRVAEIGGQNRDELEVPSSVLGVRKWQMRCEAGGTIDGYLKSKLPQLRRHLTNFRYAHKIGAHTELCTPYYSDPVDAVSIINHTDSPAFYQSQYLLLENGTVLPSMRLFDLGLMGIIPESGIRRNDDGGASTYNCGIDDLVTPRQLDAVGQFATRHDLLMHTDLYARARLFSTNQYDGLDRIEGYFKDDTVKNTRVYSDLIEAYEAVSDFRDRLRK